MNRNIKNIILLIIRILVGGMIICAGYKKLFNMEQTVVSMSIMTGLSGVTIWLVALGEFVSGLGLVFGIWTRLAALGTVVIMLGAVYFTKGENISAILLLIGSITLTFVGGGKWVLIGPRSKHLMPDLPVAAKF
jgi:putative oxidoreductase